MEERVQKILARAGYGSRRNCEELIKLGRVRINGQPAELGAKADAAKDAIMVDGKKIQLAEFNFRYLALNKPRNVLSDCDSFGERKTVHDLIGLDEHMFAVGRLDMDSEGLILMTNDGDLANKLTHPRYGHEKEYHVKVSKKPDAKQLTIWRRGVVLEDGYRTAPAIVQVTKSDTSSAWLKVILKEGRKRQIREIGQLIGLPVSRIIRVRIGTLQLGNLKPGVWRDLTDKEVQNLKSTSGTMRNEKYRPDNSQGFKTKGNWSRDGKAEASSRREKYAAMRGDGETGTNDSTVETRSRRVRARMEDVERGENSGTTPEKRSTRTRTSAGISRSEGRSASSDSRGGRTRTRPGTGDKPEGRGTASESRGSRTRTRPDAAGKPEGRDASSDSRSGRTRTRPGAAGKTEGRSAAPESKGGRTRTRPGAGGKTEGRGAPSDSRGSRTHSKPSSTGKPRSTNRGK